jgi:hypothetical protein
MSLLKLCALADRTRTVFALLSGQEALAKFVLIGGTAMALQLAHRLSEDLDFWLPEGMIQPFGIDQLMRDLRGLGHSTNFTTPAHSITNFRINSGEDLRQYVQDWSIDGVKVQFFAPFDPAYQTFKTIAPLPKSDTKTTFSVMSLQGIFAMKAHVIHKRIKSRDLVDLWHFMQQGYGIAQILEAGLAASPSSHADYAKLVLCGDVPLDKNDEGFEGLNANVTLNRVYADFRQAIDSYEQEMAARQLQPLNLTQSI